MKVLVTGASGFVGRAVTKHLLEEGHDVIATSRRHSGLDVRHEAVDLLQGGAAADLIDRTKPSHLLHLGWDVTPGRYWKSLSNLDWCAVSIDLMRAFVSAGGQRAVYAGTCAEYEWEDRAILVEGQDPRPATLYGQLKDATRRVVCAAGEQFAVPTAWGRIFWLYGPGEAPGRLVSDVCAALTAGKPVETSEGWQRRDFLHVDDVAAAFVRALSGTYHGAFNIGSGAAVPVRSIVMDLASYLGRSELVRLGARPSAPGEPPELRADIGVLRDLIGFSPRYSLASGLATTADWWIDEQGRRAKA